MDNIPVIAVDGPSASGKGTLARELARFTSFHLLNSGCIYRALAIKMGYLRLKDEVSAAHVARSLHLHCDVSSDRERVILSPDWDISDRLMSEETGAMAAYFAQMPRVREALLGLQKRALQAPGLVAEGRDMGTVVFPDAVIKIFLTASAEERAERRVAQLEHDGKRADYKKILEALKKRDYEDTHRVVSPLYPAGDAVIISSDNKTKDEVFLIAQELVCSRIYA